MSMDRYCLAGCVAVACLLAACSKVEDPSLFPVFDKSTAAPPPFKAKVAANPDRNLFWGDLHIHTSLSTDAYTMGVRTLPEDAYIFARGGEIEHGAGYSIRISRPLDFAAVTDHSEYLGVVRHLDPELPLSQRSLRQRLLNDSPLRNTLAFLRTVGGFDLDSVGVPEADQISRQAWQEIIETAQQFNEPGRFTTFVGYEWSSMPEDQNLHRNGIYRSENVPDVPFSSVDSEDPRDLWAALEQQRAQGMDNLAIPHNGNVSGGRMYDRVAFDGSAFDADYAERRMRNEPLSEIFQVKGSSETHPLSSEEDAFAGFEIYDHLLSQKLTRSRPEGSYIRDALRTGIEMAHSEGFNPYRFGVIGSTDSHNASSPADENNYHGKLPLLDGSAGIRLGKSMLLPEQRQLGKQWSAAGLAAVWAEENTRDSLFDAMRRKETYATSGPRMTVRFFGGWRYPDDLVERDNRIALAEKTGVAMGGELPASEGDAPSFAVWALKDPESGNLDRIQIIKGWVDESGQSHEQIYDVALSGQRQPDPDTGEVPAVGNTVDAKTATYHNSIGASQLAAVWTDPDFDPRREAFYYARVIEIPTPRWSTYDAVKLGVEPVDPVSIQERAVTSAIWYRPQLEK